MGRLQVRSSWIREMYASLKRKGKVSLGRMGRVHGGGGLTCSVSANVSLRW